MARGALAAPFNNHDDAFTAVGPTPAAPRGAAGRTLTGRCRSGASKAGRLGPPGAGCGRNSRAPCALLMGPFRWCCCCCCCCGGRGDGCRTVGACIVQSLQPKVVVGQHFAGLLLLYILCLSACMRSAGRSVGRMRTVRAEKSRVISPRLQQYSTVVRSRICDTAAVLCIEYAVPTEHAPDYKDPDMTQVQQSEKS